MDVKRIAIAGAGGIGSNLLAILFAYGHNRKQFDYGNIDIDIYDFDTIDVKNLLHQNFKLDDVGRFKVEVLEENYVVNGIKRRMTAEDFGNYDVIFSCVDAMPFRKALYHHGWDNPGKLFWVDGRCTSRQAALFNSDISRARLEKFLDDSTEDGGCLLAFEKEQNISHTTPTTVASMMVQVFLNKLRKYRSAEMVFMV
jgi:molybdopterin/thiamine biosynthesis adenylyltransferase